MRIAVLFLLLTMVTAPIGCAWLQKNFGPQEYVLPGPDQEYGTEDDITAVGPSKAQETLDAARPLADAFGLGHYVALGQGALALVQMGVGMTMGSRGNSTKS